MNRTGFFILAISLLLPGCKRPTHFTQMEDHGRVQPYEPAPYFADGSSARPSIPGTISRDSIPTAAPALTRSLLLRGQQRFDIYCAPCHGLTGDGDGMVVQRGFPRPPSYHIDRLRQTPDSHLLDVISNGWGAMFSYNDRIPLEDRYAIISYVRVLQLSQNMPINLLNETDRAHLQSK